MKSHLVVSLLLLSAIPDWAAASSDSRKDDAPEPVRPMAAQGAGQPPGPLPGCADLVWGQLPPPGNPRFPDKDALCSGPPPGKPLPVEFVPPLPPMTPTEENAYAENLRSFLIAGGYDTELDWAGDAHWRLSGDVQGCPSDDTFATFGVHLMVRVWYSPEVVEWLCNDRTSDLPVGAAIFKEEAYFASPGGIIVDPETNLAAPAQDLVPQEFTVMIKRPTASWDGYYWATFDLLGLNPPVIDTAGLTELNPGTLPAHEPPFYPTGASAEFHSQGSVVYRLFGYAMYCTNCHSVANSEQTFSDIDNILGNEVFYSWRGAGKAGLCDGNPAVQPLRYPASQTWDRVFPLSEDESQIFVSSSQCVGCHDGIQNNSVLPYMVVENKDEWLVNLSAGAEWRNSSMGLAGRDFFFLGRMEAEWNRVERQFEKVAGIGEKGAPTVADCVMDMCLSCHAKAGQYQKSMDTKGENSGPLEGTILEVHNTYLCRDFLPPPLAEQLQSPADGHSFFVRPTLQKWPGTPGVTELVQRWAGLGREGVTCVVCHLAGPDVGNPSDGFTGNIPYRLDGKLFGPDEIDEPGQVMEQAVGLLPIKGDHIRESRLCGACHAINLPVLKSGDCTENPENSPFEGCVEKFAFEQTTYFEYLNSAYNPLSPSAEPGLVKECQDCHMQNMHKDSNEDPLAFKVANIQDDSFYRYTNSLPPAALDLPVRTDYRRHDFSGHNVFINAFTAQFPLLLGYNDSDWMNQNVQMSVMSHRDTLIEFAREQAAQIAIEQLEATEDGLRAVVQVTNLAAHLQPSGVGFRRLFIEFSVLDDAGQTLWMSGRTNSVGQLVDGSGAVLPTENYPTTEYEPHYQVIQTQDQIQVYEEVAFDEFDTVTTGFLHRWRIAKDNRLLPRGFLWDSPYTQAPYDVAPVGLALDDPDYNPPDPEATIAGVDHIAYEVELPAGLHGADLEVRARLLSQSAPPYFLSQIFTELAEAMEDPEKVASLNQLIVDGSFLHYLVSRFDTSAEDAESEAYLKDWKFEVTRDEKSFRPGPPVVAHNSCAIATEAGPGAAGAMMILWIPAAVVWWGRRGRRASRAQARRGGSRAPNQQPRLAG